MYTQTHVHSTPHTQAHAYTHTHPAPSHTQRHMCAHTHTHSRPASLLLSLQPPLMEGLRGICTAAPARPEPPARGTAGLCTARACLVGGDTGARVSSQPLGSEPQSEHPGPGLSRPPLFPPCVHTSGRCLLRPCPGQWGLSPAPPSPLFEVWVMQSVTGCRALPSLPSLFVQGTEPGGRGLEPTLQRWAWREIRAGGPRGPGSPRGLRGLSLAFQVQEDLGSQVVSLALGSRLCRPGRGSGREALGPGASAPASQPQDSRPPARMPHVAELTLCFMKGDTRDR